MEHLAVCRRWNIPANKSGYSVGEWSCVLVILIFLTLQLLSESRLLLQISSVKSTLWLTPFGFETSRSVQIWVISVFYALFPYSIQQYFPWSSLFLTGSFVLLVFWSSTGNHAYAMYKEQCHHLNRVSSMRCHCMYPVGEKRCWDRTALSMHEERGAR